MSSRSIAAFVVFAPACIAAIYFGASTQTIFSTAPFQALGRWSYSIYLVHFSLMTWTIYAIGAQAASGSFAVKGAWALGTIVVAAAAYRWIELPMIEAGNRLLRRPSPVQASEAAPIIG
jgi:peptidoglycan/LPS O-acetylase OafA/YrhL